MSAIQVSLCPWRLAPTQMKLICRFYIRCFFMKWVFTRIFFFHYHIVTLLEMSSTDELLWHEKYHFHQLEAVVTKASSISPHCTPCSEPAGCLVPCEKFIFSCMSWATDCLGTGAITRAKDGTGLVILEQPAIFSKQLLQSVAQRPGFKQKTWTCTQSIPAQVTAVGWVGRARVLAVHHPWMFLPYCATEAELDGPHCFYPSYRLRAMFLYTTAKYFSVTAAPALYKFQCFVAGMHMCALRIRKFWLLRLKLKKLSLMLLAFCYSICERAAYQSWPKMACV